MIRILKSVAKYRAQVLSLWNSCFEDDESYISFYLDNCPDYIFIGYFDDDRLVSMLFLLDGEICKYKCKYLYAACTDTEYRRQGIMEKLIAVAKEHCNEIGYDGIFLVPANDKLYSYYSKFGFVSSFVKKNVTLKQENNSGIQLKETDDIDIIVSIKKKLLSDIKCFTFKENILKYTVREHLFNEYKIGYAEFNGEDILVFYFLNENNDIVIKEFLTNFNNDTDICGKLFSKYTSENIYISAPIVYNGKDRVEKYTKCGMCLPLNSVFSDFLKINDKLYAGMYLD